MRQRIFSELQSYKVTKGELSSETAPIQMELSNIQERLIELNWQIAGRTLNLSKSVVPGTCTLAEKLEWLKLNDPRKVHIYMPGDFVVREFVFKHTNNPNLLNYLYEVYDSQDEI